MDFFRYADIFRLILADSRYRYFSFLFGNNTNGSFPLRGMTRLGTVQNGTARFVFPPQFSTALEWEGLFTCRYSCAASTAVTPEKLCVASSSSRWIRSSAINERTVCTSSTDNETAIFLLLKERCAHSKQLRSILRWLCWFKSSRSVVSRAASSMTQAVTIFSGQSVISRVYTSRFGNGLARLEPRPRWY